MSQEEASSSSSAAIESLPNYPDPLIDSYTYHSKCPTTPGKYIMGVDEAGRGPVLGPMVYGVAFCPVEYKEQLDEMGFNATVGLIKLVMNELQITISELYVDALGPPAAYQRYLKECFPEIEKISVETKADAKYKIVGAASVAAKVTRDAWIDGWVWEEGRRGKAAAAEGEEMEVDEEESAVPWNNEFGSGYPSDPKTKAWVESTLDPTFGYPSFSRFSWATIKVQLDKSAHKVQWIDDGHTIAKAFESTKPIDKGRCAATKDLAIRSVGSL
ncbi:hypothetical protein FS837_004051 [Tulasnella sp. UAMH 9824]|nr:hypothetical protein FS837_004051 [Tulasnella sp. UAMH 9824]